MNHFILASNELNVCKQLFSDCSDCRKDQIPHSLLRMTSFMPYSLLWDIGLALFVYQINLPLDCYISGSPKK